MALNFRVTRLIMSHNFRVTCSITLPNFRVTGLIMSPNVEIEWYYWSRHHDQWLHAELRTTIRCMWTLKRWAILAWHMYLEKKALPYIPYMILKIYLCPPWSTLFFNPCPPWTTLFFNPCSLYWHYFFKSCPPWLTLFLSPCPPKSQKVPKKFFKMSTFT